MDIENRISAGGWVHRDRWIVLQSPSGLKGLFYHMTVRSASLLCFIELNLENEGMRSSKGTCCRDAHAMMLRGMYVVARKY